MRAESWLKWVLILILFLALLAGQSWTTYSVFTSHFPGGNDFYARWANGCALIWSGENPYSDEVTLRTQIGMHGRSAEIGDDVAAFAYPLYTLFLFWPLCFVQSYPLVQAIWMTLMLYTLLGGLILAPRVSDLQPSTWLWGVTLLWGVFNYPNARAVLLGQMATVVFLDLAVAQSATADDRDLLAGMLLAVTTIKAPMSFLLIHWVLWWAARQRRWAVWRGFLLTMVVLVGVSLLLVPSWMGDLVQGVRGYSHSWSRTPDPGPGGLRM